MDPQDFGFLDPDPEKYADPRIRKGEKYQPKIAKNLFTHKTQFLTFEKEILKMSCSMNGFSSLGIKVSEKKTKHLKFSALLKKFSKGIEFLPQVSIL